MTNILVQPVELRQISDQLILSAQKIDTALQAIDNDILSLKGNQFLGNRANAVQAYYAPKREALLKAKEIVLYFSRDLKTAADVFEKADQGRLFGGSSIFSAGEGGASIDSLYSSVSPLFTAVSVADLVAGLPVWLKNAIARLFPQPTIIFPLPKTKIPVPSTTQAVSVAQAPSTSSSAKSVVPDPSKGYDIYYAVSTKSQGGLYGGAACLPTSISMLLDYYHTKNSILQTATEAQLIDKLKGDGTSGKGYSLDQSKLNNDLSSLGYNVSVQQSNLNDLSAKLKDGPVIVNVKVGLIGKSGEPGADITSTGNYDHSLLVKAINANSVVVNDPWGGAEKVFSRQAFDQMWSKGQNYAVIVRPDTTPL